MQHTRLLFYAINGTGLGHLTRLLAVARSCRELLSAMGQDADIRFITSSEASEVAWDFPVYKLPSKTVARSCRVSPTSFESSSKLLIANILSSFSPDILVVDTVPQGSYGEVSFLKSMVPRMVYIDRHKDAAITQSQIHRKHIALYDRVLVPDHPEAASRYDHERDILARRKFVGPIHLYSPEEASTRTEVREQFGLEPGQRLLYLTGGGGSDSREFLARTAELLAADPQNFVLVGWGPLHREKCCFRKNLVSLTTANSRDFFPGVDAALSAGGYNTYQELLAARVPTVFFSQPKGMDRQDERIALGAEQGWHLTLEELDPRLACQRVESLWEEELRGGILDALERRPWARGRYVAATEILALHSSLPHSPVNRAGLFQTAVWQAEWNRADFERTALTARRWLKHMCQGDALDEQKESALLAWHGQQDNPCRALLEWAERLNRLDDEPRSEFIRAWCHNNLCGPNEETEERREAECVLQILDEYFQEPDAVLLEVLQGFKRPYQREALKRLTRLADKLQEAPGDALARLRATPHPWGQQELRLFENVKIGR